MRIFKKVISISFMFLFVFLLSSKITYANPNNKYTLEKSVPIYLTALSAQKLSDPVGKYGAGDYFIYKEHSGMINVSKFEGSPGAWINPDSNQSEVPETSALKKYTLIKPVDTYITALNALTGVDKKKVYPKGEYFVFKEFEGMLNLTVDNQIPGAWINPNDNKLESSEEKPLEETPVEYKNTIKTKESVNIRKGPATSYAVVSFLNKDDKAILLGVDGKWLKLDYNGQIVYSHQDYWIVPDIVLNDVTNPKPEETKPEPNVSEHKNTITTKASVNLRKGPSSSYAVVKYLRMNEKAILTGVTGRWLKLDYNGQTVYSHQDYWIVPDKVLKDVTNSKTEGTKPSENESSPTNKKIFLDPGHNKKGTGAVSMVDGKTVDEATINQEVAELAKKALVNKGYKVYMSKDKLDQEVSLQERTNMANNLKSDIFISIHSNAFLNPAANGTLAFYGGIKNKPNTANWKKHSMLLSETVSKSVGSLFKSSGIVEDTQYGTSFAVNRLSAMPSTLLELGFITNADDARILISKQQDIANKIVVGIDDYFTQIK